MPYSSQASLCLAEAHTPFPPTLPPRLPPPTQTASWSVQPQALFQSLKGHTGTLPCPPSTYFLSSFHILGLFLKVTLPDLSDWPTLCYRFSECRVPPFPKPSVFILT